MTAEMQFDAEALLIKAEIALADQCRGCRDGWPLWEPRERFRGHRGPHGWWPCRLTKVGQAYMESVGK